MSVESYINVNGKMLYVIHAVIYVSNPMVYGIHPPQVTHGSRGVHLKYLV